MTLLINPALEIEKDELAKEMASHQALFCWGKVQNDRRCAPIQLACNAANTAAYPTIHAHHPSGITGATLQSA
jgi:hypothetical protein